MITYAGKEKQKRKNTNNKQLTRTTNLLKTSMNMKAF